MPGSPVRYGAPQPSEPIIHELPPLKFEGDMVSVFVEVHRAEDGIWRGRLLFGAPEVGAGPSTAEIFCAVNEAEFWECVHDLREHHLRDLYRSVREP